MNEKVSAKDYFKRGNTNYRQGEYKEAIKDYRKALKVDPKGYSIWGNMGATFGKMANFEKTIECFFEIIENQSYVCRGMVKTRSCS